MNGKRLVALIAGVVALFAAVTCGVSESDADVAALLEMWAEMYDGTPYWQLVEELPDGTKMPLPDADDISKEKALEIATRSVLLFLGKDADFLAQYISGFGFTKEHAWIISYLPPDPYLGQDLIWVTVEGPTGEVLDIKVRAPGPIDDSPGAKG